MKYIFSFLLLSITIMCSSCQSEQKDIDLEANLKDSTLTIGWYYTSNDSIEFVRKVSKTDDVFLINPRPVVVAAHINKIDG